MDIVGLEDPKQEAARNARRVKELVDFANAAVEQDRLSRREQTSTLTKAGLERAIRAGKKLGRTPVESDTERLRQLQDEGLSQRAIAEVTGLAATTVARRLKALGLRTVPKKTKGKATVDVERVRQPRVRQFKPGLKERQADMKLRMMKGSNLLLPQTDAPPYLSISDRTKAGLSRAKRAGKILGRPRVDIDRSELFRLQREGMSQRAIAAATGLTATTVARALKVA